MFGRLMRLALFLAGAALAAATFSIAAEVATAIPFNPALSITVSNPATSANGNVRTAVSLVAGDSALSAWSLFLPPGWGVTDGGLVTAGEIVALGTMSVDAD